MAPLPSQAGGSAGFLGNIKIRTLVFAGFGALVALGAGVAGYGVMQLSSIGAEVGKMNALSGNVARVADTVLLAETIRRAQSRYRLDGDESALKEMRDAGAGAIDLMKASAAATLSQERMQTYNGIQDAVRAQESQIDEYVQLSQKMATDRAKLFSGGDELTAATNRMVEAARAAGEPALASAAAATEAAVLLVRVANWRFLATSDPNGPATFKTNAEKADAAIAKLESLPNDTVRPLVAPVRAALKSYADAFTAVSAAKLKIVSMDDEMRKGIVAIQQRLAAPKTSLASDFTTSKNNTDRLVSSTTTLQTILAAVGLLLGTALALLVGRGIVGPIAGMTAAMQKLADGDKSVAVPALGRSNEIGRMAGAVQVFKDKMIEADELRGQQEAMKHRAEADKKAALEKMADEFEGSVRAVVDAVSSSATELQTSAQAMSATAEQTSRQSTAVAAASEQASANVQTVASASEELSGSVAEITRQVSESARICAAAVSEAAATQQSMQGMAETAQKISAVVTMINDIASQTNLLALNATIEAARAGDAGKGFAVVASEVKSLANQTAKATEEIGAQIGAVQSASADSVKAIEAISATIGRVNEIATTIASAVEEQGAATKEIARNVQQAAAGTTEVSSNISGVTQAASETGSAAGQVLSAAGELSKQSEMLRGEVDRFLASVRAA